MPCYVCNPNCGRCKGVRKQSIDCPECGLIVFPALVKSGLCPHCSKDISASLSFEAATTHCMFTGNDCIHPCERSIYKVAGKTYRCPYEEKR